MIIRILSAFLIFSVVSYSSIYAKNDKTKDKIKEKVIKEKKIKTNGTGINKYVNEKKDKNSDSPESIKLKLEKKETVNNNIEKIQNIQTAAGNFKKDLKQTVFLSDTGSFNNFLNQITEISKYLESADTDFYSSLDQEQKNVIRDQHSLIQNSLKDLKKSIQELDKSKSNEILFNKTIAIERDINIIYRQYRAIEWLLFEQ